jgi:hypothetical protein
MSNQTKVALVTGSNKGIGKEEAIRHRQREASAKRSFASWLARIHGLYREPETSRAAVMPSRKSQGGRRWCVRGVEAPTC